MKKIFFTLILLVSMTSAISAQVEGKAVGLRFGGVNAGVGEVSYQHPFGNKNRVELDLGLGDNILGLTGIYHWVSALPTITDGLNWYVGPGATLGLTNSAIQTNSLILGATGQVGVEYNFDFPLQLSLDYRQTYFLIRPTWKNYITYDGICLAARYRF